MLYDDKSYYKVLKPSPNVKLSFAELWLYSVLVNMKRKIDRDIKHVVSYTGLSTRCLNAAKAKLAVKGLASIDASGKIKVAAIDPNKWQTFTDKNGKLVCQYFKVYRPSANHPLSLRYNAVFWCIQSWGRKKWYCPTIARQLGLSLRTIKRAKTKLQSYVPQPQHYLDKTKGKVPPQLQQQRSQLQHQMLQSGISETDLAAVFKLGYDRNLDDGNIEYCFNQAKKEQEYGESPYKLLMWKINDFANKQADKFVPPTAEEADMKKPVDSLNLVTEDYFYASAFQGRVRISDKQFRELKGKYPATILLDALKKLPFQDNSSKWLTVEDFLKGV